MLHRLQFAPGYDRHQFENEAGGGAVVKPEVDRFGGVLHLSGRHLDAAIGNRQFVGIRHRPDQIDLRQAVGQAGGGGHILQTGVATLRAAIVDPQRFAGDGVVVSLRLSKTGLLVWIAAVEGKRFTGSFQGLFHQFFGNLHQFRCFVYLRPLLGKPTAHSLVGKADTDGLQDFDRRAMDAVELSLVEHSELHHDLISRRVCRIDYRECYRYLSIVSCIPSIFSRGVPATI